jgi:hypothetical protein
VIERSVVQETEARTMSSVLANRWPVPRLVPVALAMLVAAVGLTVGRYLDINNVAASIGRVPVMFAPSKTPTAPR